MTKLEVRRNDINVEILKAGFSPNTRARSAFSFQRRDGSIIKIDTSGNNLKMYRIYKAPDGAHEIPIISKPMRDIDPRTVVPYLRRIIQ